MYSSVFCRAYDAFGWNVYPEVFADQLAKWIALRGLPAKTCLDLGCGTGVLCRRLSEYGIRAAGVDLSPGMIAIAREHAPELHFETGDMTVWTTGERFDLVTCTGDALNHVFDLQDVEKVFKNVFGYLAPGGAFVFDLLSQREIPPEEPFELNYSDSVKARFLTRREGDVVTLQITVYENGSRKHEEVIREKIHPPETICALLEKTGFRVLQCADQLIPGTDAHGTTWFIAAGKDPGEGNFSDLL